MNIICAMNHETLVDVSPFLKYKFIFIYLLFKIKVYPVVNERFQFLKKSRVVRDFESFKCRRQEH